MSSGHDALTNPAFWTGFWQASRMPVVSTANPFDREMIEVFSRFGRGNSVRFLEVGCGDSRWMPWLGKHFGWNVEGIEFTSIGCERAESRLKDEGVRSIIHKGDVFGDEVRSLKGSFDVVYSGGFIEHFRETEQTVRHIIDFVRPGGGIVTTVPNMYNLGVDLQRLTGYDFLKTHVRIRLSDLRRWHESAGIKTISSYRTSFGLQMRLKVLAAIESGRKIPRSKVSGLVVSNARRMVRAFRSTCSSLGLGEPRGELFSLNLVYSGQRPVTRK